MQGRRRLRTLLVSGATLAGSLTVITALGAPAEAAVGTQAISCAGQSQSLKTDGAAPSTVQAGQNFDVTMTPQRGTVSQSDIKNIVWYFEAPAGTSVVGSPTLVGSGYVSSGSLGAVSASVAGRIVKITVPGTVKNGAQFNPPAVKFTLKAPSTVGTNLIVRHQSSPAYSLTAVVAGGIDVSCTTTGTRIDLSSTKVVAAPTTTTTTVAGATTTTAPVTTTTGPPTVTTQTWNATGCGTTSVVTAPAYTTAITVNAAGGRGGKGGGQGGGSGAAGANGGRVTATFPATPGQKYSATIGCDGANGHEGSPNPAALGYSGGGTAGRGYVIIATPGATGGNGGASTGVCVGEICEADAGATTLVIAGGGGGGGSANCAGTGAGAGGRGGAGSSTAGGSGSGGSGNNGSNGNGGTGGAGGVNSSGGDARGGDSPSQSPTAGGGLSVVGGGGGGGFAGGKAGGNAATGCKGGGGGGGGSSWVANTGASPVYSDAAAASASITFVISTPWVCTPDVVPFSSAGSLVGQNIKDFKGRAATSAEQTNDGAPIASCNKSADDYIANLVPEDQQLQDARLVRLYDAYFIRTPDKVGFDGWSERMDDGLRLADVSLGFANSQEFKNTYGKLNNTQFIELVYQNVLRRPAEASGKAYWVDILDKKKMSRGMVMINFSESLENRNARASLVNSFRVFKAMLPAAWPNKAATYDGATKSLPQVVKSVRTSAAYAARFP